MLYILDTSAAIAVMRNRPVSVRERLSGVLGARDSIAISSVTLFELRFGVARSPKPVEHAHALESFLAFDLAVLPFGVEEAEVAGALRAALEAKGNPIAPYDLLIAAQALAAKGKLVTSNVQEFARVPNLAWEDWSAQP